MLRQRAKLTLPGACGVRGSGGRTFSTHSPGDTFSKRANQTNAICQFAMAIALLAALAGSPAVAGPPFRTDDPEPVDTGHFEINFFSLASATQAGWAGDLPGVEVNYGALPGLQLHVIMPVAFAAPSGGGLASGAGDLELGTKYRLLMPRDSDWFPEVGVFPTVEVPIGNQHLGAGTGHAQLFLPVWLQKNVGAWTIYGGGGYWINPGPGNRNYSFAGVTLLRQVTQALALGGEVFHQTSFAVGIPDSTGFNLGGVYDFSDTWHLLASAGTGITGRNDTNFVSYYLAVQLTF
jgi:hypothetical protein